jgi:hypothetical protein
MDVIEASLLRVEEDCFLPVPGEIEKRQSSNEDAIRRPLLPEDHRRRRPRPLSQKAAPR